MSKLELLIAELCPDGVVFVTLEDAFHIKNGYTPSKSNNDFWTNGTIPWFRMEDIRENGHILDDSIQHITSEAVKGSLFPANSIIIATSATIGEHALLTIKALANQRFTFLTRKKEYLDSLDIMYFYYYCDILDEWCKNNTTLGNFNSVDMTKFKKFKFPILRSPSSGRSSAFWIISRSFPPSFPPSFPRVRSNMSIIVKTLSAISRTHRFINYAN